MNHFVNPFKTVLTILHWKTILDNYKLINKQNNEFITYNEQNDYLMIF